MSKKEMVKVQLAQINNMFDFDGIISNALKVKLIINLKEVAREALTLADYEEVFGVKLIER